MPAPAPAGPVAASQEGVARAQEAASPGPRSEEVRDLWPPTLPFSIHVNSLTRKEGVEKRTQELETLKYDCFVVPTEVPGKGLFYRIYVGRFKDRASAESLRDRLKGRKEFQKDIHVVTREWAMGG